MAGLWSEITSKAPFCFLLGPFLGRDRWQQRDPGLSSSTYLDDNFASFVDQMSFSMELDFRQKMFPSNLHF